MKNLQKGISMVEISIVLGVVVLIIALGVVAWRSFLNPAETASTARTSLSSSQSAEVITSREDLEEAAKRLADIDFKDQDLVEAESQADF